MLPDEQIREDDYFCRDVFPCFPPQHHHHIDRAFLGSLDVLVLFTSLPIDFAVSLALTPVTHCGLPHSGYTSQCESCETNLTTLKVSQKTLSICFFPAGCADINGNVPPGISTSVPVSCPRQLRVFNPLCEFVRSHQGSAGSRLFQTSVDLNSKHFW